MGSPRCAWAWSVLVALGVAAGTAAAQDAPAEPPVEAAPEDAPADAPPAMSEAEAKAAARKLLDGGDGFLKKGDQLTRRKKIDDAAAQYERALAAYQKAYELVPNPQILFPIAVAEEKLGRWADAARDFRRFLVQVAEPDPALKADAERRLEAAKIHVGVLTLVVEPEGTAVTLDGAPLGVTPLADPLFLPAGEYTLGFTSDGYEPMEHKIAIEAGSESERSFELKSIRIIVDIPTPPPPKPVEPLPPAPSKLPLYIGGALAVGFLGGATAAGILAIGRHGDFESTSGTAQEREDARVSGKRLALITDGLLAGGIVATGVVTFYYLKVYRPKARARSERQRQQADAVDEFAARPKVMIAPWVQGSGAGLVVAGHL
ncbi:MAG: PEGA domain-containing protein [Kofleriaceae bacterium]|jgi:hypothetical protein|nr:PEGA domain-containing protein [Kofleriaceae bacterium]MBP9169417.1 PEGA domain-containing protein [Kofleriaceae bacterium]MBP9861318.1 PEGA domain-containing protein [Kofleriaceae bacterium]